MFAFIAFIAINAIFAIIGLVRMGKKQCNAVRIIVLTVDWILIAIGVLYAASNTIRVAGGSAVVTDEYILNIGGKSVSIPLFSRLFRLITADALISILGILVEVFAVFAIIVLSINRHKSDEKGIRARKEDKKTETCGEEKSEESLSTEKESVVAENEALDSALETEPVPNGLKGKTRGDYSLVLGTRAIAAKSDKKDQTCVIRNKIVLKSDAESVYLRYEEEKAAKVRVNE